MQGKSSASNALAPSRSLVNANFSIILNADRVTGDGSTVVTLGCPQCNWRSPLCCLYPGMSGEVRDETE